MIHKFIGVWELVHYKIEKEDIDVEAIVKLLKEAVTLDQLSKKKQ